MSVNGVLEDVDPSGKVKRWTKRKITGIILNLSGNFASNRKKNEEFPISRTEIGYLLKCMNALDNCSVSFFFLYEINEDKTYQDKNLETMFISLISAIKTLV